MSKVPAIYQLGHLPIKDHVFSPDRSILAITKGNDVEVYQISPSNLSSKPQLIAVLKDHDKTVTSVDISPDGSKILTCSQDRIVLPPFVDGHQMDLNLLLVQVTELLLFVTMKKKMIGGFPNI